MRVLATRRAPSPEADGPADQVRPASDMADLLPEADALLICLPHTPQTDGRVPGFDPEPSQVEHCASLVRNSVVVRPEAASSKSSVSSALALPSVTTASQACPAIANSTLFPAASPSIWRPLQWMPPKPEL